VDHDKAVAASPKHNCDTIEDCFDLMGRIAVDLVTVDMSSLGFAVRSVGTVS
jgi:hypothetical protein